MKPNFSSLELLKLAISIEEQGIIFYTDNAEKTEGEKKAFLTKLANDEKEHAAVFRKIYDEYDDGSKDFNYLYDIDVDTIFTSYAESEVFALRRGSFDSFEEVLKVAAKTEQLTIDYYTELEKSASGDLKNILQRLIKEEEGHLDKILRY